MSGDDVTISGDGWSIQPEQRPTSEQYDAARNSPDPIPEAEWFWRPLERWCVAGCCGLGAYDFSPAFVRWVTHQSTDKPKRDNWRFDEIGDLTQLTADLRSSSVRLRALNTPLVFSKTLDLYFEPGDLAKVLDRLVEAIESPTTA